MSLGAGLGLESSVLVLNKHYMAVRVIGDITPLPSKFSMDSYPSFIFSAFNGQPYFLIAIRAASKAGA